MVNRKTEIRGKHKFLAVAAMLACMIAQRGVAAECGGDCDGNGSVEIHELVLGVNIAFGTAELSRCPAMDGDGSSGVEIQDLVGAVGRALNGCPVTAACAAPAGGRQVVIGPGPDAQDAILSALIEAQPKDVIYIKAGRYSIDGQLSLQVDDVKICSDGMDQTVLSFANQTTGAEGLLVQANHFTLENIGLEDAPGDLFKILGADGVTV